MLLLIGSAGLCDRYRITRRALRRWYDVLPPHATMSGALLWELPDIEAWETERRAKGLPLPGERRRGPRPGST